LEGKNSYRTHTALIPGIRKAKQALGMAWHGMDLLLCGMDGQGRQGEQIGEGEGLPDGGKSLAFQSWMGREGKNYELLNEKYGWKRVLPGPGRGGWAAGFMGCWWENLLKLPGLT
jgi:hypothetical protein